MPSLCCYSPCTNAYRLCQMGDKWMGVSTVGLSLLYATHQGCSMWPAGCLKRQMKTSHTTPNTVKMHHLEGWLGKMIVMDTLMAVGRLLPHLALGTWHSVALANGSWDCRKAHGCIGHWDCRKALGIWHLALGKSPYLVRRSARVWAPLP